ncbi:hypothetical protein HYPSUDRAFT_38215 [Hypholoma sublateritium FD-334 SS-4]|uniref:Uncharacterized protein n=1 Tax=Hypholoma sublateritium (strain FD-334 SS-4) TaxID=945553 RepID=A0A0D2MLV0_HYPSF|nr:hypothetical protein HYPSUDRAFT_38215 [Hypholoma sublateritium FD-334 SS-4]
MGAASSPHPHHQRMGASPPVAPTGSPQSAMFPPPPPPQMQHRMYGPPPLPHPTYAYAQPPPPPMQQQQQHCSPAAASASPRSGSVLVGAVGSPSDRIQLAPLLRPGAGGSDSPVLASAGAGSSTAPRTSTGSGCRLSVETATTATVTAIERGTGGRKNRRASGASSRKTGSKGTWGPVVGFAFALDLCCTTLAVLFVQCSSPAFLTSTIYLAPLYLAL